MKCKLISFNLSGIPRNCWGSTPFKHSLSLPMLILNSHVCKPNDLSKHQWYRKPNGCSNMTHLLNTFALQPEDLDFLASVCQHHSLLTSPIVLKVMQQVHKSIYVLKSHSLHSLHSSLLHSLTTPCPWWTLGVHRLFAKSNPAICFAPIASNLCSKQSRYLKAPKSDCKYWMPLTQWCSNIYAPTWLQRLCLSQWLCVTHLCSTHFSLLRHGDHIREAAAHALEH